MKKRTTFSLEVHFYNYFTQSTLASMTVVWGSSKTPSHVYIKIEETKSGTSLQFLRQTSTISPCNIPCERFVNGYMKTRITVYGLAALPATRGTCNNFEICSGGFVTIAGFNRLPPVPVVCQLTEKYNAQDFCGSSPNSFDLQVSHKPPCTYSVENLFSSVPLMEGFIIKVFRKSEPMLGHIFLHDARNGSSFQLPCELTPVADYVIQVDRVVFRNTATANVYYTAHVSRPLNFRAYMTKVEVDELYLKAQTYSSEESSKFAPIQYFYRNKWPSYFNDVLHNTGGIMVKYDKNWSGDRASSLHHNIQGLFFSTSVDPKTLSPPSFSYYGPIRLLIPADKFLIPESTLYFADFYCHYVKHKVTLVITWTGSKSDQFCKARLKKLDKANNPFLYIRKNLVCVTLGVVVEVYFTENIHVIHELMTDTRVKMERVRAIGDARRTVHGIPKRGNCDICNLKATKAFNCLNKPAA